MNNTELEKAIDDSLASLISAIDKQSSTRIDFVSALPRKKMVAAIDALIWLYGARQGSAASIYASVALSEALDGYLHQQR